MIRDIVFDIGGVFVGVHPQPMLDFLASHGAPRMDLPTALDRIGLAEHEIGRVDGAGLIERFSCMAPRAQPVDLLEHWLGVLAPLQDMMQLAHRLAAQHGVYLLSNIGDLHWNHLVEECGMDRIGHGALPSFQCGLAKPDSAIYAQAENCFTLRAASTVFVDDRAQNIQAARARGWHGIVHRSFNDTRQALLRLGVEAAR